ncbi:MAG TPA: hypothetical protein VFZ53_27695 [Polyangiaceae bacterium]
MILASTSPLASKPARRASWFVRAAVAGLALAAFPAPASARPEFPGVVQETLALDCAPPCTVCHTSAAPEGINAEQPFVVNLQAWVPTLETRAFNEDTLPTLLTLNRDEICRNESDLGCVADGMCTRPCDANGNNVSDIEDLIAQTDPNPGAKLLACPKYGCGAHLAPERPLRPIDGAASLLALGAACLLVRRARR